MKIVIIGGSGLIGTKLGKKLAEAGHEAVAASPKSGVNTLTGEGLAEVLKNAQVVVDVSNSPSFADADVMAFFKTSTGNLLACEAAAGVGHHVALSIVKCDEPPGNGYFRAKVAQEKLIKESSIPYTIVRSTQFLEFAGGIADAATKGNQVRIAPSSSSLSRLMTSPLRWPESPWIRQGTLRSRLPDPRRFTSMSSSGSISRQATIRARLSRTRKRATSARCPASAP